MSAAPAAAAAVINQQASDPKAPVRRATAPARLRLLSLLAVAAIAVAGIVGSLAAADATTTTDEMSNNTAPVLVALQDLVGSMAEADAAATSVFLSGANEDRQQRLLYQAALARAAGEVETVARLVGDDPPSHEALKRLSAELATYSGLVESARVANLAGAPDAEQRLQTSLTAVRDEILPEVAIVNERTTDRFDRDAFDKSLVRSIAPWVILAAIIVLLLVQWQLAQSTRRILSPLAVVGTIALVVMLVWLLKVEGDRSSDLDTAQTDGLESIRLTAEIQTTGFGYRTQETLGVLNGERAGSELRDALSPLRIEPDNINAARQGGLGGPGLLLEATRAADSPRERAAAAELLERWQRYVDVSDQMQTAAASGDRSEALALSVGAGSSTFNGFNTAVESVLLDNRDQFLTGVQSANDRLKFFSLAMLLLPILAALAVLFAFQIRINDYR